MRRSQGILVAVLAAALLATTASARTLSDDLHMRMLLQDSDTDTDSGALGAEQKKQEQSTPDDNFGLWEHDGHKMEEELKETEKAIDKAVGGSGKETGDGLKRDETAISNENKKLDKSLKEDAETAGKGAKGYGAIVLCSLVLVAAVGLAVYKVFTMSQDYKAWSEGSFSDRSNISAESAPILAPVVTVPPPLQ